MNNSAVGTFVSGSTIPDIGEQIGRGFGTQATAAVDAALRIEFDASSKVLSLLFDVDGGLNGYTWLSLVQADIDAGPASWQMTDSDTFDLYLNAGSFTPTAAGEIYLDNFQARVPEPATLSLVMLAGLVGTRRLRGTQHPRERQVENEPAKC